MKRLYKEVYKNIKFNEHFNIPSVLNQTQKEELIEASVFDDEGELEETSNNVNKEFTTNHYCPDFDGESELE